MTKALIDTNVILDVLLDREPHAGASVAIWGAVEMGSAEGLLAANVVTTIHYLIRRDLGLARARRTISTTLRVFGVAMVDGPVIAAALELLLPDFEDAVTAAQFAGCDDIVTGDPQGFRGCRMRVLTPEAAAPLMRGA
jgi:predicted nucleic acid-binding protein